MTRVFLTDLWKFRRFLQDPSFIVVCSFLFHHALNWPLVSIIFNTIWRGYVFALFIVSTNKRCRKCYHRDLLRPFNKNVFSEIQKYKSDYKSLNFNWKVISRNLAIFTILRGFQTLARFGSLNSVAKFLEVETWWIFPRKQGIVLINMYCVVIRFCYLFSSFFLLKLCCLWDMRKIRRVNFWLPNWSGNTWRNGCLPTCTRELNTRGYR